MNPAVVWHDVECGSYVEDLPLWRELAAAHGAGQILDVGAGTGRVALDLARSGHRVTALDVDAGLLAELERRAGAGGLAVATACADARAFDLGAARFSLVLAPMQTVQLLGGPDGRGAFLRAARAHLADGGLVACALADAMEAFDAEHCAPPLPDVLHVGGTTFSSQPVALRDEGERVAIERIRQTVDDTGRRCAEGDVIHLDRLTAAGLVAEARAAGLRAAPPRAIPPTEEHVGSTVVLLRG